MVLTFFRGNEKNIPRDCFIWNTVAGLVNAAEAIVFMMIVTRTNGIEIAGILSIAFAVGNLLMTIGKFGVRNFQVTDVKRDFSFNSYFTLRIISCFLMAASAGIYLCLNSLWSDYTVEKTAVIAGICFIYMVESLEDVFLGFYQIEGRLDVASKVFVCRWGFIMISFSVCIILKKDVVLAVWISAIISVIMELVLLRITKNIVKVPQINIDISKIKKLIKQCFALFVVAFLTYYVTNAPKYAIDRQLPENMQAYYGYISMPVFVVELLNCFLYQPQMVGLAEAWENRNLRRLKKKENYQFLVIMFLTVICVLGAYIFGIPVLSLLYGVNLGEFKLELIILMIAGGALAFVGYTGVLLTVMRKQQYLLYNMLIVTMFSLAGFEIIVKRGGVLGAAIYYLILMIVLALLNYISISMTQKN